jgi:hypothetical protein
LCGTSLREIFASKNTLFQWFLPLLGSIVVYAKFTVVTFTLFSIRLVECEIKMSSDMKENVIRFDIGKILIHQDNESDTTIIKRSFNANITPLEPLTSDLHLPKTVLGFIEALKPNSKGLCDRNGSIFVEVNMTVLQSAATFEAFLSFYRSTLEKFPELKHYASLYEKSAKLPWNRAKYPIPEKIDWGNGKITTREQFYAEHHETVTTNLYVEIKVLDMLLEKLICHFGADRDFPISDSITFLLQHGLTNQELIETFGIPERNYYNLKKPQNKTTAKIASSEQPQTIATAKMAVPEQPKTTAIATLPS